MIHKNFRLNPVAYACLLACSVTMTPTNAQQQPDQSADDPDVEVITVTGIRNSIKQSLNEKRFANEILDTISAEDIGQLPDENIAEALQRVTGIQMSRTEDGEGSSIQVRGLSDNNVEINGVTVAGSSADRAINFQDIPSELFSAIEIQKAPTADKIEGSLGGTINLKTRKPLNNNKDFLGSVTARAKYAEIAEEFDPDVNAFLLKNWRNNEFGDFGIILNLAAKKVTSITETYGGGIFDTAPAVWLRRSGDFAPPQGGNNPNGRNLFHPNRGAGIYAFDDSVDVNGDGVSDENDVYYMPGQFGFAESLNEDTRESFNATLHWQPNNDVNVYLDATITSNEETASGSRYSINTNAARAAVLSSPDNTFERLGSTTDLGDVYYMSAGRIGNATTRIGASPNINIVERDSALFRLSGDWQFNQDLKLFVEASTSDGEANTIEQGALIAGIDYNGNGQLTGSDFAQIVDFNFNSGLIPNATLYESPFPAPTFGVTELQTTLTPLNPADITYERLNYFQLNRVANDTENTADAFRFDGEWNIDGDFITNVNFGARWSERTFSRVGYENPNQRGNFRSRLAEEGDELVERINVQAIRVNPASNPNDNLRAASEFLQGCFVSAGGSDFLSDQGSNLPRVWTSTKGCSATQLTNAFGLEDIRALREDGTGVYERLFLRFDVEEETKAIYFSADFETEVGGMPLIGNFGARYIETETVSAGFEPSQRIPVEFTGDYDDILPSLNANLVITDEMVLRLGVSRSLGRPGLSAIAPSLRINRNDELDGFDGSGESGNPNLEAVHSNNIDLSYEWYFDEESLLSIAYFRKDIDSRIARSTERVPVQVGDELFAVAQLENGPGTEIDGLEVAVQHAFKYLPGFWAHTGAGFNYTYTNEDSEAIDSEGDEIARRGLSENSFNITAFYDDGKLSARFAYNWRDEFVRREQVDLGFASSFQLPEVEAARGQLDFSANYQFTENLKVNFSAVNLNNSKTERFMKYEPLLNYYAEPGRRYNLGIVYRF